MDLVLCHTTADFDTLGAAVGVSRLCPGAKIVLTGGCHPAVQKFLALSRDRYNLIERRAVSVDQIRSITLVDTHHCDRIGPAAAWVKFALANAIPVTIYDHHPFDETDIHPATLHVEPVGATTTLVVEALQAQERSLNPSEATVMALGIHVDTGSLTFEQATPRDAAALAWLMAQGADQKAIASATEPGLSAQLQVLLTTALDAIQIDTLEGYQLGWVYLKTDHFTPGLSSLASHLMSLLNLDSLLLGSEYATSKGDIKLLLVGRARSRYQYTDDGVNFQDLFAPFGGGGYPYAASAVIKADTPTVVFSDLVRQLHDQVPHAPVARDLMSSPVRTIRPETTIAEAQRILLRYGHAGLCVVQADGRLVGVISRRDIDLALHHGFSHAPVKGYMTINLKTITPDTSLAALQTLMVTYDIGRLPVLDQGQLVGIVTRTDVLRQVYHDSLNQHPPAAPQPDRHPLPSLYQRLQQQLTAAAATQPLWQILTRMAQEAQQRGWHLYLVGGAVRDLLLADADHPLPLKDIDLVVDSLYSHALVGAGVELAQVIQQQDPTVDLQVHGQFQTAALIWHTPTHLGPLVIDVATARTEFYPYPAANPEVEASSIRQDLYRRDFTINAMAIRLTPPQPGLLLDFFGGWLDLQQRQIRVLHANSFIEDPTRIYRAVRFAVRLGFDIDRQTEQFIRHAIDSGIYTVLQGQPGRAPALQTRLKAELKYILESLDWPIALSRLDQLGALSCLHPTLTLTPDLWHQLRRVDRWIQRFQLAQSLEPWQMLLEVLIASLAPAWRQQVAAILQLPASAMDRLTRLAAIETELLQTLSAQSRPSEIYQALKPYDLPTLLLVSTRHPRRLGPQAWQYWTRLSAMKPLLNGDDLKHLGYAPGPLFRTILTDLTNATLNGDIRTRQAAQKYVQQRYPR